MITWLKKLFTDDVYFTRVILALRGVLIAFAIGVTSGQIDLGPMLGHYAWWSGPIVAACALFLRAGERNVSLSDQIRDLDYADLSDLKKLLDKIPAAILCLALLSGCTSYSVTTQPPPPDSLWDRGAYIAAGVICSQLPESAQPGASAAVVRVESMDPQALYDDLQRANGALQLLSPALYAYVWEGIHWITARMPSVTEPDQWILAAGRIAKQACAGCGQGLRA